MIRPTRILTALLLVMALSSGHGNQDRATKGNSSSPSAPTGRRTAPKGVRPPVPKLPLPVKALIIGDSLSFGPFGEEFEELMRSHLGKGEVALVASCGSSPENWLSKTPVFVTKCGYRVSTPTEAHKEDFQDNGRKPRPIRTPKIRAILSQYLPETVFIQQGTNWLDQLPDEAGSGGDVARKLVSDFISEVRERAPAARIIWILPPESSRYSSKAKDSVERWILRSAEEKGFEATRSREMTGPYERGKTGSDGIHYSKEAAGSWARLVFWSYYGLTP
jgi:hypothetical protein